MEQEINLYVTKSFFLSDNYGGDILVEAGSTIEQLAEDLTDSHEPVVITDPNQARLCTSCEGILFWLEKDNQNEEYWEEHHGEDATDHIYMNRKHLETTSELSAAQMQEELANNPVDRKTLFAEHDKKKRLDRIDADVREEHERIDAMTLEECLAELSKAPKSEDSIRQVLKDEIEAETRAMYAVLEAMTLDELIASLKNL